MSAVLVMRTPTLLRELCGLEMGTDRQSVSRAITRLVGCSGNTIKLNPQRVGPAPGGSPLPQRRHSVRLHQAFGSTWGRDFRCLDFLSTGHASHGLGDVCTLPFGLLDI